MSVVINIGNGGTWIWSLIHRVIPREIWSPR